MTLAESRGPAGAWATSSADTLVAALRRAAEQAPDHGTTVVGVNGQADKITYRDLLAQGSAIAGGLIDAGFISGQVIVLHDLELADFFPAFWGCVLGGFVPLPLMASGHTSPREAQFREALEVCALVSGACILTDQAGAAGFADLAGPALPAVLTLADCRGRIRSEFSRAGDSDVALMLRSSGSSGRPKVIPLKHEALIDFAYGSLASLKWGRDDAILNWLPVDASAPLLLAHILPLFACADNMHVPVNQVMADPLHWFDLLSDYRITYSLAPAFAFRMVSTALAQEGPRDWNLSHLAGLISGGEMIQPGVFDDFVVAMAPHGLSAGHLHSSWGMTETVTGITWGRYGESGSVVRVTTESLSGRIVHAGAEAPDEECTRLVTAGVPAPGAELRVVDAEGRLLMEDVVGHLQVRSIRVTPGYIGEGTEAFVEADDGGLPWLDTGDLAFMKNGAVFPVGRTKDVIIANGEKYPTYPVERVMESVEGVIPGLVAACGVPDPKLGTESPILFFAAADGVSDTRALAREVGRTAMRQTGLVPGRVVAVPAERFPRASAGKILRSELVRMLPSLAEPMDSDAFKHLLRNEIANLTGTRPKDDVPFYELGLTSVMIARLHQRLGRANLTLSALFEYPTINELAAFEHSVSDRKEAEEGSSRDGHQRAIAVIGMALRFPGASSPMEFWDLVRSGTDGPVAGGKLHDADFFDADFFGISPKEASLIHPGHRLFLECSYEALETGGYATHNGPRIGVFAGEGANLLKYQMPPASRRGDLDLADSMLWTFGSEADFLASRVSYRLGLTGPAIGIKTACSSSLVAVHLAVQSLLAGDADLALAGASAVQAPPRSGYVHHPDSVLSASGMCRPFDVDADGTIGADGVAVVLLKPLASALEDGDPIIGVITGTAVNNDGRRKVGFTAPSSQGQSEAVRAALRRAGISGTDLTYVEAHGTGTPVGDPVEFGALSNALLAESGPTGFCALGSVKSSVGHLDACAGMAGLIKVLLMLRHRMFVPTANLRTPHPDLDLSGSPFTFVREAGPMPSGQILRAGVNALGVGGTNAFVVVEEAPEQPPMDGEPDGGVVRVSGSTPGAVIRSARTVADWLDRHPETRVASVAASMAVRPVLAHSTAVAATSAGELGRRLRDLTDEDMARPGGELAFVYSGQGTARPGMAQGLYGTFPEFRAVLDECERIHRGEFGDGLLDGLLNGGVQDSAWAQPAHFALQAALTAQWEAWGVRPGRVLGHSLGELAALHAAGAFCLEDGIRFAALRGRLMRTEMAEGGMLAVRADIAVVERVARDGGLYIAAQNGTDSFVLAGGPESLQACGRLLDEREVPWRSLEVNRAFHSPMVDPVLDRLADAAAQCGMLPLRIPLISGPDGSELPEGETPEHDYLVRQALLPVRFDLALATLGSSGIDAVVEIGARDELAALGRRALRDLAWIPSQAKKTEEVAAMLDAVAAIYRAGQDVEPELVASGTRRIALPGYSFERIVMPDYAVGGEEAHTVEPQRNKEVLKDLLAIAGERLGVAADGRIADTAFTALGADSLTLMALSRQVERRFGVAIPVQMLFETADTPRKLAETLELRLSEATESRRPAPLDALEAASKATSGNSRSVMSVPTAPSVPEPAESRTVFERFSGDENAAAVDLEGLLSAQLRITENMFSKVSDLMSRQLDMVSRGAPPVATANGGHPDGRAAGAHNRVEVSQKSGCDYSLYFFGDYPAKEVTDEYEGLLAAVEFADRNGFHGLWFPERHFASFGGLFPNPSVLAAAFAARTSRIRINAGSVVLPLHNPIRVAEEWAVVDNLSRGRVGLCVASGWHANDFVLAPEHYENRRELTYERVETVRRLWSGDTVRAVAGGGAEIEVGLFPKPVQERLPMAIAVVGNPESYRRAARHDLGVVTNLMTQSVADLAANVALYRRTRAECGLDPDAGRVVVLLHTYLDDDGERARTRAAGPFRTYLRSSLNLLSGLSRSLGLEDELENTPPGDLDFVLDRAFRLYCDERALIGSPRECLRIADAVVAAGANEIACFVDFGISTESMVAALPLINILRDLQGGVVPFGDRAIRTRELSRPAVAPETAWTPASLGNTRTFSAPGSTRIPAAPGLAQFPTSTAQRRLWLVDQTGVGRSDYLEPKGIVFDGPLDIEGLRTALNLVVARHSTLRAVFREVGGELKMLVRDPAPIFCPLIELPGLPVDEALARLRADHPETTFDLAEGPLFAMRLARTAPDRHILYLVAHHIVFDSFSTQIFCRDLAAYYRDPSAELPPLRPDVYIESSAEPDLDFWITELDAAPVLTLPYDVESAVTGKGASLVREFGTATAELVDDLARAHGATSFMVLMASLGALLGRISAQDDFMLGMAVSNRQEENRDRIGMFIETVVLRTDLSGEPDFVELLRRTRTRIARIQDHLDVPFDELVSALNPPRVAGVNPLFGVMVEYERERSAPEFSPPEVSVKLLDLPTDRALFELSLCFARHERGLRCLVEYDAGRFDEPSVERLLTLLETVINRAGSDPNARLSSLTGPTDEDQARIASWQGAVTEESYDCLHHLVERQVDRTPDAVAVISGRSTLTYTELDNAANRLAHGLIEDCIGPGDAVAVFLRPSATLVVAVLAVLKTGAAYVPLDPSLPDQRVAFCLGDSKARTVLTEPELSVPTGGWIVRTLVEEDGPITRPEAEVERDDLAYCIYTSGSSGQPKAVQVPHRGPVNLLRWQLACRPTLRTLQWTSIGFDVSVQEIFGTLASGAALVIPAADEREDPAALNALMNLHQVERIHIAYTPLKYFAEYGFHAPSLKEVCVGGEELIITPAIRRFLQAHPEIRFFNQYGPTEASVIVTAHRVRDLDARKIPIGRPIDNVAVRVADDAENLTPIGVAGELWLGGACLADGYLGDPSLTAERFVEREGERFYRTGDLVRWRSDGDLEYLGRIDEQVKIRGHRVEPGETQSVLSGLPGVLDAAVVAQPTSEDEPELVAYLVMEQGLEEDGWSRPLRAQLAATLPDYMVPTHWMRVDRLSWSLSGKLDKTSLPSPQMGSHTAGRSGPLEQSIQLLWAAEFGDSSIDLDESFFNVGGNSLKAVRILVRIRERFGIDLSFRDFVKEPTIRAMARAVAASGVEAHGDRF